MSASRSRDLLRRKAKCESQPDIASEVGSKPQGRDPWQGELDGTKQPIPREIWILVSAAFIIALGFGLIAPILPQYARSFDVGGVRGQLRGQFVLHFPANLRAGIGLTGREARISTHVPNRHQYCRVLDFACRCCADILATAGVSCARRHRFDDVYGLGNGADCADFTAGDPR